MKPLNHTEKPEKPTTNGNCAPDWRALLKELVDDTDWLEAWDYDVTCRSCYRVVRFWRYGIKHYGRHAPDCKYVAAQRALRKHS